MTTPPDPVPIPRYRLFERWVAIAAGAAFLAILAYAALRDKPFGLQQFFLLRLFAAIFAMAIGSYLGGSLHVEVNTPGLVIRACGAAAFFVLVWLFNPPQLVAPQAGKPGDYDKDTALAIIAQMKNGNDGAAEKSTRDALTKYPESCRLNYNLACIDSRVSATLPPDDPQRSQRLDEADSSLRKAIQNGALSLILVDEKIESPVDFVLNDADLQPLLAARPGLRPLIEGHRSDFTPVMGTKSYSEGGCFGGDTLITMASGELKPISAVAEGEEVSTGRSSPSKSRVIAVGHVFGDVLVINEQLCVSSSQPLLLAGGQWKPARDVVGGDVLARTAGNCTITSLNVATRHQKVYWLAVTPCHQYVAGGFIAHNKLGFDGARFGEPGQ